MHIHNGLVILDDFPLLLVMTQEFRLLASCSSGSYNQSPVYGVTKEKGVYEGVQRMLYGLGLEKPNIFAHIPLSGAGSIFLSNAREETFKGTIWRV